MELAGISTTTEPWALLRNLWVIQVAPSPGEASKETAILAAGEHSPKLREADAR